MRGRSGWHRPHPARSRTPHRRSSRRGRAPALPGPTASPATVAVKVRCAEQVDLSAGGMRNKPALCSTKSAFRAPCPVRDIPARSPAVVMCTQTRGHGSGPHHAACSRFCRWRADAWLAGRTRELVTGTGASSPCSGRDSDQHDSFCCLLVTACMAEYYLEADLDHI